MLRISKITVYILFAFFGIVSAQESVPKNHKLLYIDEDAYKFSVLYVFKDSDEKNIYIISPKYGIEMRDTLEKMQIGSQYKIQYFKLCQPIHVERSTGFRRVSTITYFCANKKEEAFIVMDAIVKDVYYSPNILNGCYYNIGSVDEKSKR